MRLIKIQAIYPKKKTTIINKKEYKYPYLLTDIEIIRPNQVWATDITYIKTPAGFVYLESADLNKQPLQNPCIQSFHPL